MSGGGAFRNPKPYTQTLNPNLWWSGVRCVRVKVGLGESNACKNSTGLCASHACFSILPSVVHLCSSLRNAHIALMPHYWNEGPVHGHETGPESPILPEK
jgi:hypothetical protein